MKKPILLKSTVLERPPVLLRLVFSLLLVGLISSFAMAQSIVKGRISDETGTGMPGVNVIIKGTTVGATTDAEGQYSLEVPAGSENATIVVSFIGYVTEEQSIAGRTAVDVNLTPSIETLNEIVVVGYGVQKKSDITGAVASINSDAIREVPTANVVMALQGRVAGVDIARNGSTPGSTGQIRIRGNRSLISAEANDPFIVVNGIPFGGTLNDLNQDDIATIDVLKDASATAIYGSRGSNGVILITTKKGKTGRPQLTYNAYYGVSKAMGKYDMMNTNEFVAFRDLSGYSAGYSAAELQGIADGVDSDWQSVLYNTGHQTNHDLNMSGGNAEGTTYGISAGYFKEDGIITGQSFERYSLRTSIDSKIGERINIGLSSLNTLSYRNGEGVNPLYATLRITPMNRIYNTDGTVNLFPLTGTVDATSTMNPLTLDNTDDIVDRRRRIRTFNSLYGELKIVEGLKYRANIGLDFFQDNRGQYFGPNTIMNSAVASVSGARGSVENGETWRATIENLLIYDKTFSEKHHVTFTGLYSTQIDRNFTTTVNGNGYPSGDLQYYNFSLLTSVTTPSNDAANPNRNSFNKGGLKSYMARVNYVFNERYLLTATYRIDGSSVFPVNKYLNYPALALGWNISQEDFMSDSKLISAMKFRVGYGVSGQQQIPGDATRGSLSTNRYTFGSQNVFGNYISGLPNAELRWEDTKQWNIGLDFGLIKNRITGSIELYQQNTDNLIVEKSLPRSSGVNSYWTNAASTSSKGIEINLSTINVETGGFRWTSDFNFSMNREKIVSLADKETRQDIGNGWFVGEPLNVIYDYKKIGIWQTDEAAQAATFGQVPGNIKLADISGAGADGLPDGIPDGAITSADRSIIGNFQPDWIGGTTQRFAYKNFELSTVLFARMGGTLVATYLTNNGGAQGYFGFGNSRANQVDVDYWTTSNPTNDFPAPNGLTDRIPYSSTLGYYDASFIKMRSINLSYAVPNKLIKRTGMSAVRLYITVNNPFVLYSPFVKTGLGFDPEGTATGGAVPTEGASSGTGVSTRAITVGLSTPAPRQYLFGINVTF